MIAFVQINRLISAYVPTYLFLMALKKLYLHNIIIINHGFINMNIFYIGDLFKKNSYQYLKIYSKWIYILTKLTTKQ